MADTEATVKVFRAQLERYNLPAEINQLDEISRNGRTIVDWGGKFSRDANGDIIYNFGKHKGKRVKDEPGYADWMLKSDFPEETKKHLREVLKPVAL